MSTLNINQDEKKSATRWLRSISKYITKWVYLSSFVGFAGSLLLIWQMYLLSYIVYQAYFHSVGVDQLKSSFIMLLLIVFARALLTWLKDVISFKSSLKIRTFLRQKVLAHINELGPVHAGALSSAQLTSSLTEQIESLHDYLMYYLPQMNLAVFVPIAMLCFIFPISIVSGLILMVCAPLIPLFMALIGMGASSIHQKHFQTIARMNARFLDIIQGLTTLKLFGKSQQQLTKIHQACDLVRINIMRVLKVAFLSSAVLEVFAAASIALLAVYLGMGFLNAGMDNAMWWELDDMTLHGALFILLLAPEFFMPLRDLGSHYHARAEAIGAALEIKKVLELESDPNKAENQSADKGHNLKPSQSVAIELKKVNYTYAQKEIPALHTVDLMIHPGEKIALVGSSGAGKTTLLNLLLGFMMPSSGSIKINDQDLSNLDMDHYRQYITWVGQKPKLFQGDIESNLRLGNQNATSDELHQALKFAAVEKEIQQQSGLETPIHEQNMGLSVGQAQRIAIARAYLKNAPLMLLDEPTASLDHDHEQIVLNNLVQFWSDKTVVFLTHRFEVLKHVDRIICLENGTIKENGRLATLQSDENSLLNQLFFDQRLQVRG